MRLAALPDPQSPLSARFAQRFPSGCAASSSGGRHRWPGEAGSTVALVWGAPVAERAGKATRSRRSGRVHLDCYQINSC
ncbi:MAG: hypothetical protein EON49_23415 [Acidovorax sp.]|nr:MAG: hypothetical protein EON49_23415 [Acidovorax sp.]